MSTMQTGTGRLATGDVVFVVFDQGWERSFTDQEGEDGSWWMY